jgi:hypothetical protein
MSTVLESSVVGETSQAVRVLRDDFGAIRLGFTWWGIKKSLTDGQKDRAAESFGAEGDYISAGKKLIDNKNPQWKALVAKRGEIKSFFASVSLPYPESAIRLVKVSEVQRVTDRLSELRGDLHDLANELDRVLWDLKDEARRRLGDLFNPSDYPSSVVGLFDVSWDLPSVEPPDYLNRLNPRLYAEQSAIVQARFSEAVALATEAFTLELSSLIEHLTERLSGSQDGKPKVFRDSAIENFREFFTRFRSLNIGSSADLDSLVEQAQQILNGVTPGRLRANGSVREIVSRQLSSVRDGLDSVMENRPRRNIDRGAIRREDFTE